MKPEFVFKSKKGNADFMGKKCSKSKVRHGGPIMTSDLFSFCPQQSSYSKLLLALK